MNERIQIKYVPSFGRRRSRPLGKTQKTLMETYYPGIELDLNSIEKTIKNKRILLEIGFGDGEHLIHLAKTSPDSLIIGCETYVNGVGAFLVKAHAENISNVRLFPEDSRLLLEKLPPASIDAFYILFPDPWPKRSQYKRRIVNQGTLDLLYPVLKPDGFIRLATDHTEYFEWMKNIFTQDKRFKLINDSKTPPNHIPTKYQQKALIEGRHPNFLEYIKED